ncbi:hypothetical protein A5717_11270 [Mycolicibacterium porcinum]|uniref:AIPR family protein n=1 Tax=Mycolicibacterium porcinum TaxID=39693 RepID=UPI00080B5B84|nr:AIPR family protein [Mycolicibacterium porcinum]OCB14094.1 hypothetical protein A5717_11270 [Mycolicibacterium porcinum]
MPSGVFVNKVEEEVAKLRADYPGLTNDGDAFAVWALAFLHDLDLDTAVDACAIGGPNDHGIDAVYIDEENWKVYLIQAKYSVGAAQKFGTDAWRELFAGYARLLDEKHSASLGAELANQARQVRTAVKAGAQVVLEVVLFGSPTAQLSESVFAASGEVSDGEAVLQSAFGTVYSADDLEQLDQDRVNYHDLRGVDVGFRLSVPLMSLDTMSFEGLTEYYLAIIDAHSLGEVAAKYKAQIVDWNVRYKLGNSSINRAIAATIKSDENRAKFLLLNNGITMICKSIKPVDDEAIMMNPQIVNGAQTALTLGSHLNAFKQGDAQVLARIAVVADDESGNKIAREIAESTNRQNPVTPADLKSQDKLQQRIEYQLAILSPEPWYYERRKNSYTGLSDSDKKRFGGRKLTKEDAGQRYRAMIGSPAQAIRQKRMMFDDPKLYGEVFSEDVDVASYLLADALYQLFYDLLGGNQKAEKARTLLHSGFDDDMRRLLTKARNLWAAHGSALAYSVLLRKYEHLTTDRLISIASSIRAMNQLSGLSTGDPYFLLVKFVVSSIIKWIKGLQQKAIKNEEPLSIKDAFQGTGSGMAENAFEELKIEAELIGELVGDPRDVLPN